MTSLVIIDARIRDGTAPEPTDPMAIAVEDGRIRAVGPDVAFDA